ERFDVVERDVIVGGRTLRIAHPRDAEALIDEEAFARDDRLPYWADVWPSALALAAHVLTMAGAGRSALGPGCGGGGGSTAAALAGFAVTATDYYEDALAFTAANVTANTATRVESRLLDWRALPASGERFDVVLAADVLYERPYGRLVAAAIDALLRDDGVA